LKPAAGFCSCRRAAHAGGQFSCMKFRALALRVVSAALPVRSFPAAPRGGA
jgi:hypothetical protein